MKKLFLAGTLVFFIAGISMSSVSLVSLPSKTGSKQSGAHWVIYGVVPKDKVWLLYRAENRSTEQAFVFINGKEADLIFYGKNCSPYCYISWDNSPKRLVEGQSVGVAGGNGIFYQVSEIAANGVK
jgi:hypothetical protein